MKYLAHVENSLDSDIISIYEVLDGLKKSPKEFEKKRYYSLWHLTPMTPKAGLHKKPHFAFLKGSAPSYSESQGGESIEHAITKHIIYKSKKINLKFTVNGCQVENQITFSEIKVEHHFDNNDYIADLYGKIESNHGNLFNLKPNDWLVIEICVSHKVTKYKQAYYRLKNIAAIEIKLYDKIKFEDSRERLDKRITGWLNLFLYFKPLHNPNYKEICKQDNVEMVKSLDSSILTIHTVPINSSVELDDNKITCDVDINNNSPKFEEQLKQKSWWKRLLYILGLESH